jgi:hypothetical protein
MPQAMMASTQVQPQQVQFGAAPNLYTALHGQPSSTAGYAGSGDWFLDTGASTHMATYPGIPNCRPISSDSTHIIVGNGALIPCKLRRINRPVSAEHLRSIYTSVVALLVVRQ